MKNSSLGRMLFFSCPVAALFIIYIQLRGIKTDIRIRAASLSLFEKQVEEKLKRFDETLELRTKDRWTKEEMQQWIFEFERLNPLIQIPSPWPRYFVAPSGLLPSQVAPSAEKSNPLPPARQESGKAD